jgi:hypothetical protein
VLRLPFLVDDYFVPNGCFGDSDCGGGVIDINSRACSDRMPSVQGVCRRYRYSPLAADAAGYQGYLGILFQDVGPNNDQQGIGTVPPLRIEPGARRVVFWAKVGAGDSVLVHFRAGGANNWEGNTNPDLPYKDSFGVPQDATLGPTFQQVVIDLSTTSYQDVVSPFGWAIKSEGHPEPIDLYIDDLRWE